MLRAFPSRFTNLSVRTKLLLSYVLLFAIPLGILGVGGYKWISDTVGGYAQRAYTNILEKTIGETDGIFIQLDALTEQLSNTKWVKKITYMQGGRLDETRVDAWSKQEYRENMRAVKSAMKPVEELGILFLDKNTVIASHGTSDMKFMAENAFQIDGMGLPEWNRLLAGLEAGESCILPGKTMRKYGVPGEGMLYVRPISITVEGTPRSFFFAFIRRAAIEENLRALLIDEGVGVTVAEAGRPPFLQYGDDAVQDPIRITLSSPKTGWEYGMSVPARLLVRNAENVRAVILAAVGLLCLICLAVAFGLMRNMYRPVGELVSLVRGYVGAQRESEGKNEYSWLQDGIHAMVEQENALKSELESRKPLLRETWLGRLVCGDVQPLPEFERALALLGIGMPHANWRVCVVTGPAEPETGGRPSGCTERDCRAGQTGLAVYALRSGERGVFIVNYDQEDRFDAFAARLAEGRPTATVGIGGDCHCLEGVAGSYQEAAVAIDYRPIGQESRIVRYTGAGMNRDCYYYPLEMEYRILSSLQSGDAKAAVELFRSLFAANLNRGGVSAESMLNLLTNMELTALKALDGARHAEGYARIRAAKRAGRDAGNIAELSRRVEDMFRNVAELAREKNASFPTNLERIVGFVDASITNSLLSLAFVADRFQVSQSYISRVFRESYGKNYHSYVNEKRIACARELLLAKPDISSVARAVGYDSDVTFRRVFKQTMGVSPSAYRESLKHASGEAAGPPSRAL